MTHRREGYSLTKLISTFLLLLFMATVCLSLFYFLYFSKTTYSNKLDYYRRIAFDNAQGIADDIRSAEKQLDSIVAISSNSAVWFATDAYESMLSAQSLENALAGSLRISNVADAIIVISRKSDMIIEAHSMTETDFQDFLNQYNHYNSILPSSRFFVDADKFHYVLSQPITKRYYKTMLTQTVGTAYITIPFDTLLSLSTPDVQQVLYCPQNRSAQICAAELSDPSLFGIDLSTAIKLPNEEASSTYLGRYMVIAEPIEDTGIYLLLFIPRSELVSSMFGIFVLGVSLLLVILVLTILGIRFISNRIHAPINSLIQDVQSISEHDETYRLRGSRSYEVADISDSINHLLDELEQRNNLVLETRENLRELRLLHRESQMLALQSQVNPHFLYNTLECVRSIAQSYQAEEVSDILDPMISIYRYSSSNQLMGTVGSECESVQLYASIIQIRFGNRIQIRLQVDPSVEHVPLPRMVLHPIVENAVNHGYANTLDTVDVLVEAKMRDGMVVLSVTDHGCGIAEQELELLMERITAKKLIEDNQSHVGLRNVHQRICREFGNNFGLKIESIPQVYTTVTVTIPTSKKEGAK